jgi:hypothetical protein
VKRKKKLRPDRYVVGWTQRTDEADDPGCLYIMGSRYSSPVVPDVYDEIEIQAKSLKAKVYEIVEVTK